MNLSQKPKTNNSKNIQLIDHEFIILDKNKEQIHQLNQTASFIFRNCNGENTIGDIISLLTAQYSLDDELATSDVINVIKELEKLELLE